MKKRISLVLTAILLLAVLAGCGQTEAEETTSSQPEVGYAQDGYAEGRIGDTMHSYFFDYTVNSAYLCDEFSGYTPSAAGYRLLVAEVTVKNTNRESIVMYDTDFQVQWGDDSEDAYDFPITLYVD